MLYRIIVALIAIHASLAANESEIRQRLNQWPQDIQQKNMAAVCELFAPDLVASYPGTADRNYQDMCRQLTQVIQNPAKTIRYDQPEIEEIIVDKDIAIVRLIWTVTVLENATQVSEVVREKGLDVFQRQADGSWKIKISYAYPLMPNPA